MIELVVALGILTTVTLPLAFSFRVEQQALKKQYYRAVAMEIVDGEMEVLAAGEWRAWPRGRWQYPVTAESAKNLPAGWFILTVQPGWVRLEWVPKDQRQAAPVKREVGGRR